MNTYVLLCPICGKETCDWMDRHPDDDPNDHLESEAEAFRAVVFGRYQ